MWLQTVCDEATRALEELLTSSGRHHDEVQAALQRLCVQLTGRDLTGEEERLVLVHGAHGVSWLLNDFLHERAEVLGLLWEPSPQPAVASWVPDAVAS